jgi:hypothetical protein
MKPNRWFSRPNTVLSTLRIAIAGALVVAAGSVAFVAAKTNASSTAVASEPVQPGIRGLLQSMKKGDADRIKPGQNRQTAIGANESRHPDLTPDVERYLNRAYPADEVPMKATVRAQQGWAALVAASANSPAQAQVGVWKLIGPDAATYPGVLNVLGDGGAYIASGRITALAIAPTCTATNCPIYVGAAGGGVWSTPLGLANNPAWTFLSNSFGTNAIGSLYIDKNVAAGTTIFAGTGEPNVSGDSESGVGIYRSTNAGVTWTLLPGSAQFAGRAISSIDTCASGRILAGIARAVRGVSSTGGATSNPPIAVDFGVYSSTDSGATFQQIGTSAQLGGTVRGVTQIIRDPDSGIGNTVFYASVLGTGVYRTVNTGTSWQQIKTPFAGGADNADRPALALGIFGAPASPSFVRAYVGNGSGTFGARFYSTQAVDILTAVNADFIDQTTAQNINYCTGQCWYDNAAASPIQVSAGVNAGGNTVYLLGSFDYNQIEINGPPFGVSNGRAVLLSTDGGLTWSDLTQDGKADPSHNEFTHPDQHAIVFNPNNRFQYWEGNDGGIVRSSGVFVDDSAECASRGLTGAPLAYCQGLLNRVPSALFSLNQGLSTLQFQSVSATTFITNKKNGKSTITLQGGTQDNGTFQYIGLGSVWPQIMYGDGGQSGFGAGVEAQRFNTFTGQANDVNFRSGNPLYWCIASAPIIVSPESSLFYPPVIADPVNARTIFEGSFSVWRTQNWGGNQAFLEANCPEFTTSAAQPGCGDFVRIGNGVPSQSLTNAAWGDRNGGNVSFITRDPGNATVLWASTSTGRLFYSANGGNAAAGAVVWERLDHSVADLAQPAASQSPGRFITGIAPVPNTGIALVSYNGYAFNTPAQPGHIYRVQRTSASNGVWTNFSFNLPDFPATACVLDLVSPISPSGLVIYAASDFGVMRYIDASGVWTLAGTGLPQVECSGLTILPDLRHLYVATHGRSVWDLPLPGNND